MSADFSRVWAGEIAWVFITVALFRAAGPRKAVLTSVLGGYLLFPGVMYKTPLGVYLLGKQVAVGAGLLLGVIGTDPRAFARTRLHWLDLPMLAYVVYPLTALASNDPYAPWSGAATLLHRGLGWFVPYLVARMYFPDGEGARQVGIAVVIAGLAYVPLCLFETSMGPDWYLARLVYGLPMAGSNDRLGGWRPEGLLNYGLELATWMALAAVTATWLWVGRGWRPRWGPSWWPPLVLVLTSVAVRGVYGYLILVPGLVLVLLSWVFRTRWFVAALAVMAPLYVALRLTGVWDGMDLVRFSGFTGRSGTIYARISSENGIIGEVLGRSPVIGFGVPPWDPSGAPHKDLGPYPDAWWLHQLWEGGLAGLTVYLLALFLVPAVLGLAYPPGRPTRKSAYPAAWGLALFSLLHMTDGLHNLAQIVPTALIAGTLVGRAVGRLSAGQRPGFGAWSASGPAGGRAEASYSVPTPVLVVAGLTCVLNVFGHAAVPGYDTLAMFCSAATVMLFALAGWAGDRAAARFPLARVAVFGLLFASLGVSLELVIHPSRRPADIADVFQTMALCAVVVAAWRRWVGDGVRGDSLLALAPMAVHFLVRPYLARFPGSQYFVSGTPVGSSFFPLFPYLTVAVLGARAAREKASINLVMAALFAAATASLWLFRGGPGYPDRFPVNLTYAMFACAAVEVAFPLAGRLAAWDTSRRALGWLGARWMIFFYWHFFIHIVLERTPSVRSPWAIWSIIGVGSLAGTWLTSTALAPLGPWMRRPYPWAVLLAAIALLFGWPGDLPPQPVAVAGLLIGLVFAAHYGALATCVAGFRPAGVFRAAAARGSSSSSRPWRDEVREPVDVEERLGPNLLRFAAVLALLAAPEAIRLVTGPGREAPIPALLKPPPPSERERSRAIDDFLERDRKPVLFPE